MSEMVVTALAIGLLLGGLAGFAAGVGGHRNMWHLETVERGLAIYCPQNGQWAWIGECGDE